MNIIGKLPLAKAWVVHYNSKTGAVYGDYEEPIGLSIVETKDRAERAIAFLAANTERPVNTLTHPGWNYPRHDPIAEAEWKKRVTAYNYQAEAVREYERMEKEAEWACFDMFSPVFREVATFVGYTRGRSSVTMQFKFANGSILEIGPSGIDKFINGVQSGAIERKDGGFLLTFRMEKKGANVYMWPMCEPDDFKGMKPYEAAGA